MGVACRRMDVARVSPSAVALLSRGVWRTMLRQLTGRGSREMPAKETLSEAHERNQRAFLRIRRRIAETHAGQWVGLVDGEVAAAAPSLRELESQLDEVERDPGRRMVFQAGEPYPFTNSKIPILPFQW